jgi:hypothetical protein
MYRYFIYTTNNWKYLTWNENKILHWGLLLAKRKRAKEQTMIYNAIHRKYKIEQHEPTKTRNWTEGVNWSHHFDRFTIATMTVAEYLCHKWPRMCSVCRYHKPVLSLIIELMKRVIRQVPQLSICPEHLSSIPGFSGFVLLNFVFSVYCIVDHCLYGGDRKPIEVMTSI